VNVRHDLGYRTATASIPVKAKVKQISRCKDALFLKHISNLACFNFIVSRRSCGTKKVFRVSVAVTADEVYELVEHVTWTRETINAYKIRMIP
jgi:hypothetical protein